MYKIISIVSIIFNIVFLIIILNMYYNTSNKITKNNIDLSKYSSKSIWKSGEYLKIGDFKESPNGKIKIYVAFMNNRINLMIKDLNEYYKDFSGNKIYDRNLDNLWIEEFNKHKNDLCYKLGDGNTFNFRIGYVKNNTFTNIFDECNGNCGSFYVNKHAEGNKLVPVKKIIISDTEERQYLYDDKGTFIKSSEYYNIQTYKVYNISYILLRDDGAFVFDKNNILQGIL
jgi:hypothetical protein